MAKTRQLERIKGFTRLYKQRVKKFVKAVSSNEPVFWNMRSWDWLVSIFIPTIGLSLILLEIDSNRKATLREIENNREVTLQEIEANREALQESFEIQTSFNQQQALQNYLQQITSLVDDNSLIGQSPDSPTVRAATGLTLAILDLVGSQEKKAILNFLDQSALINKKNSVLSLKGGDLSGIDLSVYDSFCSGRDLSAIQPINLSGTNLSESNLSCLDLSTALLDRVNLSRANLSYSDLSTLNLTGSNLSSADLSHANLDELFLSETILAGANFSNASLQFSDFSGKDFSSIKFLSTNLRGAKFNGADLRSVSFERTDLRRADFRKGIFGTPDSEMRNIPAYMQSEPVYASFEFSILDSARLSDINLRRVSFVKASLKNADLHASDFSGSNLQNTILEYAKANEAVFDFANLEAADLSNAELLETSFRKANLEKSDFSSANLQDSIFTGTNLWKADLSSAENLTNESLRQAIVCNTKLPNYLDVNSYRNCVHYFIWFRNGWIIILGLIISLPFLQRFVRFKLRNIFELTSKH